MNLKCIFSGKEARLKGYTLYDCNILEKANKKDRYEIGGFRERLTTNGQQWWVLVSDKTTMYLHFEYGYINPYICQNSELYTKWNDFNV